MARGRSARWKSGGRGSSGSLNRKTGAIKLDENQTRFKAKDTHGNLVEKIFDERKIRRDSEGKFANKGASGQEKKVTGETKNPSTPPQRSSSGSLDTGRRVASLVGRLREIIAKQSKVEPPPLSPLINSEQNNSLIDRRLGQREDEETFNKRNKPYPIKNREDAKRVIDVVQSKLPPEVFDNLSGSYNFLVVPPKKIAQLEEDYVNFARRTHPAVFEGVELYTRKSGVVDANHVQNLLRKNISESDLKNLAVTFANNDRVKSTLKDGKITPPTRGKNMFMLHKSASEKKRALANISKMKKDGNYETSVEVGNRVESSQRVLDGITDFRDKWLERKVITHMEASEPKMVQLRELLSELGKKPTLTAEEQELVTNTTQRLNELGDIDGVKKNLLTNFNESYSKLEAYIDKGGIFEKFDGRTVSHAALPFAPELIESSPTPVLSFMRSTMENALLNKAATATAHVDLYHGTYEKGLGFKYTHPVYNLHHIEQFMYKVDGEPVLVLTSPNPDKANSASPERAGQVRGLKEDDLENIKMVTLWGKKVYYLEEDNGTKSILGRSPVPADKENQVSIGDDGKLLVEGQPLVSRFKNAQGGTQAYIDIPESVHADRSVLKAALHPLANLPKSPQMEGQLANLTAFANSPAGVMFGKTPPAQKYNERQIIESGVGVAERDRHDKFRDKLMLVRRMEVMERIDAELAKRANDPSLDNQKLIGEYSFLANSLYSSNAEIKDARSLLKSLSTYRDALPPDTSPEQFELLDKKMKRVSDFLDGSNKNHDRIREQMRKKLDENEGNREVLESFYDKKGGLILNSDITNPEARNVLGIPSPVANDAEAVRNYLLEMRELALSGEPVDRDPYRVYEARGEQSFEALTGVSDVNAINYNHVKAYFKNDPIGKAMNEMKIFNSSSEVVLENLKTIIGEDYDDIRSYVLNSSTRSQARESVVYKVKALKELRGQILAHQQAGDLLSTLGI